MKIINIGSDHAGFKLKEFLKEELKKQGYGIKDFGTDSEENVDYPLIGKEVAEAVAKEKIKGILICGTGIGMSIVANKVKGIRAAVCCDEFTAKVASKHNNANILCLGARILDNEQAIKIMNTWLNTEFSKEERHRRRVDEINEIECK